MRYGGIALALAVVLFLLLRLGALLRLFFASVLWAYLSLPLMRRLERRFSADVAAILTLAAPILVFILLFACGFPVLRSELVSVMAILPQRLETWMARLSAWAQNLGIAVRWEESRLLASVGREEFLAGLRLVGKVSQSQRILLLLSPLLAFYWLRDRGALRRDLLFCVPPPCRALLSKLLSRIHERLQVYLRAQFTSALWVGFATALGLRLFSVPFAALSGILMALLDVIPTFGPLAATVCVALLTLAAEPSRLVAAILVCVAAQQLENALIVPLVLGGSLSLHPLAIFAAILAGGCLFGAGGMLLAVPLVIVLREIAALWPEFDFGNSGEGLAKVPAS